MDLARLSVRFAVASGLLSLAACSLGGETQETPAPHAHVVAFSTYEGSLGSQVEIYGTDFPTEENSRVELEFKGEFQGANGRVQQVNRTLDAQTVNRGEIKWVTLGPYKNPFSATGDEVGTFRGTVGANIIRTMPTGEQVTEVDPTPMVTTFRILPSIVVRELQPVGANCAQPAVRGLGGFAYKMRVAALGFQPTAYTYSITTINEFNQPETTTTRHLATSGEDSLGENGEILLPNVSETRQAYAMVMSVEASDAQGRRYSNTFSLGVHRPLEIFYNGNVRVAQRLAPVPVSACIPAGDNGGVASYSEGTSESRSRSYGENWDTGRSVDMGTSRSVGTSASNGVSVSVSMSTGVGWSTNHSEGTNLGVSVDAGAGLPFTKLIGIGGSFGKSWTDSMGTSGSMDMGTSMNVSSDSGMSTSEATSGSVGMNWGMGGSTSTSVSTSNSIDRNFSRQIIAGRYGVWYRQTVKLLRRAAIISYNQCGQAQKVGDVNVIDWAWSPDLAQGTSCGAELPPSNLPPAQCYVPSECDGQQ